MNTTPSVERCTMLLNKLISVIALAVLVFAESDSDIPHVRSKRTIGVVLKNVGDLFGFDVFRRPAASAAVPAAAGTLSDNVGKSFTIAINWNKNRTHANRPAAAPAAAAAPAPAPAAAARPASAPAPASSPAPAAPASGPAPAAAPASGPAPAAAPASGAAPSATPASGPAPTSDASPAAAPAPASADAPASAPAAAPDAAPANAPAPAPAEAPAPAAPRRPSGPPTKAQLYVEYVDDNGNAREAQEKEEDDDDDDDEDRPKRIQIGLPDYSSVDYNEVKRDLANQGNNDIDHSREKFKQEFNNFWEASPWTLEHGYKFIVPQGPDAIIDDITKGVSRYQEFDLPKKNNARSLKIVHNVKVYHQPAKTETYNDVENQKFYTAGTPQRQHELHILDEEGVRYIVHQNGKKMPIPSNINAQLLEFFKKKFQADAAAQRKAAVEGQQNAIQSNTQQTTPAPIVYTKEQAPVIYVPPEIIKQHIDNINKEISKPITHPNEQPEIKEERHVLKVNHYRNDETPQTNYGDQPETVNEPEYLDIKEKVEAGPPKNYISVSPHENLNSYIANARPGQIVKIKIVEPSQGANIDIKRDGDSDDVRKNVQREKEKVTERHEKTETEHYKKSEEPRVEKIEYYPGFNYKEYEKVGYPNFDDTKDKDFRRGFSEEQKKNLEDHYNFFSSARDPRGRDKEQLNTKTSDKYDKEKSDEETKTKVNVEDNDKKSRDSYSSQKGNLHRKDEGKEDTEEDEEERPQNIKYESATKKEDDEDDEDERPLAKKAEDDENDTDNKRRSQHEEINREEEDDDDDEEVERRPKLVEKENLNNEEEDEDGETEDRPLVKKENINEEEDDDDDEAEEQPKSTERENITEEEDDEDDEVEDRPKSVEKEDITDEEEDEDDEVENRPKLVERENITYEDDDDDDEVEDRPKSTEKENITEEEEEDEEIENDDEESKQRPKIINNDAKEKFEVENFYDSNPKEFNSERQQQASNQNKDNFITELDSFINSHFKDKNYLNEIDDGNEKKQTRDGNDHEKEFDDVFSKLREGTEYEDFYKQFQGDAKFTPSKQNLIDSETKTVRSKEKQQPDSTVVQPLYSGVLHAPAVQELFKSNKPLTVPFEHDYSASEPKSRSAKPRTKRSTEFWNEEDEDEDESQYVPDRYTVEDNYETPEPKMPDFAKLEAKQYKDDDTLSPKARVSKVEDGQKTTWINVKVPVTYITDVRT